MSKLLSSREALVYPPDVVASDPSWSYIYSYVLRPSSIGDLDAKNYKFGGAQGSAGGQEGGSGHAGGMGGAQQKGAKKDPIDRFASIVDAEDQRFEKQRKENYKNWESGVQNLCIAMNRSIDAFYDRKSEVYETIICSALQKRDDYSPQVDITEMPESIKDLALGPWNFQSLGGTNVS